MYCFQLFIFFLFNKIIKVQTNVSPLHLPAMIVTVQVTSSRRVNMYITVYTRCPINISLYKKQNKFLIQIFLLIFDEI